MNDVLKYNYAFRDDAFFIHESDELSYEISKYKQNIKTIERNKIIKMALKLNIIYKKDAISLKDQAMLAKINNNRKIKIITINKYFTNFIDLNEFRRYVIDYGKNNLAGKKIMIKDTNTLVELSQNGIKKTFSGRVVEEKLQTIIKLEDIISEAIYFNTTYNPNDNTGIKYHHFLVPVKVYTNLNDGFIRIVIKEYSKNPNMVNKFYYHQFEFISSKKGITSLSHIDT